MKSRTNRVTVSGSGIWLAWLSRAEIFLSKWSVMSTARSALGLAIIQTLAADGELRHYVVVGLGTNGPVSDTQIRQLSRLIGPDRDLILINTFGPMPWEASVNEVLDGAARHMTRVSLADWHAAIAGHTDLLWPDGIHPQPSGAKLYARVVLAALQALLAHAPAPPCGRPVSGPG